MLRRVLSRLPVPIMNINVRRVLPGGPGLRVVRVCYTTVHILLVLSVDNSCPTLPISPMLEPLSDILVTYEQHSDVQERRPLSERETLYSQKRQKTLG